MSSPLPAAVRGGRADERRKQDRRARSLGWSGAMVTSDVRRAPRVRSQVSVGRIRKFTAGGLVGGACALLSAGCVPAGGEAPSAAIAEQPQTQASRVRRGQEGADLNL